MYLGIVIERLVEGWETILRMGIRIFVIRYFSMHFNIFLFRVNILEYRSIHEIYSNIFELYLLATTFERSDSDLIKLCTLEEQSKMLGTYFS